MGMLWQLGERVEPAPIPAPAPPARKRYYRKPLPFVEFDEDLTNRRFGVLCAMGMDPVDAYPVARILEVAPGLARAARGRPDHHRRVTKIGPI